MTYIVHIGEAIRINTIFNSVPNDKILDWSKLKGFADDKINVNQKVKFVLKRVENIVGKGENAGNLFPRCFQKVSFSRLKFGIVLERVNVVLFGF